MPDSRHFIPLAQARAPFFAGVDLGGTNIKLGIVDDVGRPLSWTQIATEVEQGPQVAVERAAAALNRVIREAGLQSRDIARVGLGTPGTMDVARGILLAPGNLPGWWNFPIRDALSRAAGLPVTYANDARSAAYGEYWAGSGRVLHSMILFTLGTGVGGGIVIGDVLVEGEHSAGSELGHLIIDLNENARLCSCGLRGHVEAYCSAPALVRRTAERLPGRASSLAKRTTSGEQLTALLIDEEAERGDALALEMVLETARYLGVGIASAMHAIDPNGVVIGGAMTFGQHDSTTGRKFLDEVKREVAARALPNLAAQTTIDFASLGGDAGFIGAAGLARREHQRQAGKN
jgi:glucokinase